MKIINDIYLLTGEKLISVEKPNGHNNIFYFENNIHLTGKDFNRETYILIKCSITGELIKRKYNEKFLYEKIYLSPSASVSGERNGMHGKGYLLKGHKVSEETKKKLLASKEESAKRISYINFRHNLSNLLNRIIMSVKFRQLTFGRWITLKFPVFCNIHKQICKVSFPADEFFAVNILFRVSHLLPFRIINKPGFQD